MAAARGPGSNEETRRKEANGVGASSLPVHPWPINRLTKRLTCRPAPSSHSPPAEPCWSAGAAQQGEGVFSGAAALHHVVSRR